jgi:hypothetical protein
MRYRILAPALRHTPEYRRLSRPAPNGRTLLEWLMTGDCTTILPGLLVAGRLSLMEQLGWDDADDVQQRQVWQEVIGSSLVRHDPETRLIWLPFMVSEAYLPDQPQVLKSWAAPWAELPDCDLKHEAWAAFRAAFMAREPRRRDALKPGETRTTAFGPMFLECCPEPRCARAQARNEPQNEAHAHIHNHSNNDGHDEHSRRGSQPSSGASSQRGSLQDQDQDQDLKGDLTRAGVYKRFALLWGPCQQVLHADFVPCTPLPHPELPGELMEPLGRDWLECLRRYNPSNAQLTTAAEFLFARQHWQDQRGKQGITLNFLLKPPGQNFSDLLHQSEAWRANGKKAPQSAGRRRGGSGHVPSSAPAEGLAPSEEELRAHLNEGANE